MSIKICPYCAEEIQSEAIVCKHCQKDLETPEAEKMFKRIEAEKVQQEEEREAERIRKKEEEEAEMIRKEEERKEKELLDGMSKEEKKKYFAEKKRQKKIKPLWVFSILASLILLSFYPIISFLIIFSAIWIHPNKGEVFFKNRFKNYKKYIHRIVVSSIVLIILFPFIVSDVKEMAKERQATIEQQEIANYPEPEITISSSQEPQGQVTEYFLEFSVSEADEVFVNDNKVEEVEQKYSYTIPLDNITTRIRVSAKNEHKNSSSIFDITRDETEEEEKIRLEEEVEVKAEAERKKAELEKAKAEREAKAKAEKLAWERSKAGKLCAKYPTWSKNECKMIADKKHYVDWLGMTYDMLIELRGRPNSANPSDYGYGKQWQWCWHYYTPSCFYDDNDDGVIDSYN